MVLLSWQHLGSPEQGWDRRSTICLSSSSPELSLPSLCRRSFTLSMAILLSLDVLITFVLWTDLVSSLSLFLFHAPPVKAAIPVSTLGNHTHPSRLNVKATFRVNPFSNTSLEASLFLSSSLPLLLVVCLLQPFFLPCSQDNFCASSLLLLAWEPPEGGNVRIHRPIPYSKSEMAFFEYDVGNVHFREQIAFPQSVSLSFTSDSRGADMAGRWKVCALSCI